MRLGTNNGISQTNFWRNRSVLVTGATGLLGSWIVKALIGAAADVVCLIRDWVPDSELVASSDFSKVKVVRGSVDDSRLVERTLGEYEVQTVLHLAAQTIVGIANRNPISTFESNIAGTWSVLEACRRSPRVNEIVVASSDKAYGEQPVLPYDETMPVAGIHPYDVSKSCTDLIARSYAKTFDLPVVITRCGNLYGGGDLNWNRIVPGTIRSLLHGETPIIRSDGEYIRDYFYVEDAAAAYMKLAEHLSSHRELRGEAFNFSTETPTSVIEIVNRISCLMGADCDPVILNEANHEIRKQFLSARKAQDVLGWRSLYSLDEGLRLSIEWYRNLFLPCSHPDQCQASTVKAGQ